MPLSRKKIHRRAILMVAFALAFAAITRSAMCGTVEPPPLAQADTLMAAGDFSDALLETAAAMKAAPDDPMLAVSAGNLIRELPRLRLCLLHEAGVNTVVFSPDGRTLLSASEDNSARLWDVANGKLLATLPHKGAVWFAVFSPDGLAIVTASEDGTALVWDAKTGQPRTPPLRHSAAVVHATFSTDGKRVITASSDHTARIWNAETGEPIGMPLS